MKAIIVAYDKKNGIGADNDLLWQRNLPADLQHFKKITSGNTIIMGSKTYQSIGRPLPGRQNIVISRSLKPTNDGIYIASNLQLAYDLADADKDKFVIGGGQIYALAIDTVDRIYATEVNEIFDNATVYFPEVDHTKWREISREKHTADGRNLYDYDFVIYERI
ncbi:MAG: dihydrofolate reductase [Candidatus Saccharibacteria bacterium]